MSRASGPRGLSALRADSLGFRYPSPRRGQDHAALEDVSFEVEKGEIFGVLGPNGAGKTTLMKILSTVLVAHEGALEVLGHALPGGEDAVRARIGVAFAEYERAFSHRLTGRQNLEYFSAFYGIPRAAIAARVAETLATVGLAGKADTLFHQYSTGMKHRLALARALLPGPDLLLLDEPTAGLDAQTTRELGETLRGLARGGTSIVYTTHRLEEAASLCDRVLILRNGRVAAMAAPWELARLAEDVSVIEVTVKGTLPDALDELRALPGVASATLQGRASLRLQTTSLDATLAALVPWLAKRDLPVASLTTAGASLADAFIAITEGRLAKEAAA